MLRRGITAKDDDSSLHHQQQPGSSRQPNENRWLDFADGSNNAGFLDANQTTTTFVDGDTSKPLPPSYHGHHPKPPKPTSAGFIAWYCILAVFACGLVGLGLYYVLVYYGCLKPRSTRHLDSSGGDASDEDEENSNGMAGRRVHNMQEEINRIEANVKVYSQQEYNFQKRYLQRVLKQQTLVCGIPRVARRLI